MGIATFLLGVFLARQGLVDAGLWSEVLGLFVNLVGAVVAIVGLWLVIRKPAAVRPDLAEVLGATDLRPRDPRRIGRFHLLGRVGIGALGEVYLGRAPDGGLAAIKLMPLNVADDPRSRLRFEHELRDMRRVQGPRFPTLLAADTDAERPWLATEYEPALTLEEAIDVDGPLGLPTIAWLAAGVAEALTEIHALGIVHRDLKPSNVLMDENGPRLIDFGIARTADDPRMTSTGMVIGTVAFMAPEQARADNEIGPAADIFALGSMLAYAATGKPPFGEGSTDEVLIRIRSRRPDLGELARAKDPVAMLIKACLNKDPRQRPSLDQIVEVCRPYRDLDVTELLPDRLRTLLARRRNAVESARSRPRAAAPVPDPAALPAPARPWWRPTRTKTVAVLIALAVGTLLTWRPPLPSGAGAGPASTSPAPPWKSALAPCAQPDTDLRIASSVDKDVLLQEIADEYGPRSADGRCVRIVVSLANSGRTAVDLATGWPDATRPRPDVWIPTATVRLELARTLERGRTPSVFPREAPSVMRTPLVIAMPEPMARALGWPEKNISWRDLAELATVPGGTSGWARHGHPEWGPFRLAKTNPHYSTSGLNATIGMFYASRSDHGRADKLTEPEVADGGAKAFVHTIEQSIAHYGQDTARFLPNLRRADDEGRALDYVSAVAIDENSMLAYNVGYPNGTTSSEKKSPPKTKLVAIYPEEGTIEHDHPYAELAWPADDTTAAKHKVSNDFLDYLHTSQIQTKFQDAGFRDHERNSGRLGTPENGINSNASVKWLPVPDGPVLNSVITAWDEVRKPAKVLLVIDTSTSMSEGITSENPSQPTCAPELKHESGRCLTKLELLQRQWPDIVSGFTVNDSLGLWTFSGKRDQLVEIGPVDEIGKDKLSTAVTGLRTAPRTALYDTVAEAVATVAENYRDDTINAVVVLTDGRDEHSTIWKLEPLLQKLREQPVRVFTIAYGHGSVEDDTGQLDLEKIAQASQAAKYDATDPGDIREQLVAAIISNF